MIYKHIENHVKKLGRRFYIVELVVIILLSSILLGNFMHGSFSNIHWLTEIDRLGQKKRWLGPTVENGRIVSFLRNNLVIDWDYYGYLLSSGKKKAVWPDRDIYSSPVFLNPAEKKPYYLFNNFEINFATYPLRLFRNFTRGDGTIKFAENHKEIKALVFYKNETAKVMKINRKIERIEWEDKRALVDGLTFHPFGGGGNTLGILFFDD